MDSNSSRHQRVFSGMRPTGRLHLGHYHGVLKKWVDLQHEYECFFSIVDIHALTTHYSDVTKLSANVWEMAIDWLAAGINPGSATLFIQSQVPEHLILSNYLAMITPLSWLERVPTYKEQQEKLKHLDLSTYGFLGYPLLQAADILAYKAILVPVGEDQIPHIELAREIARRFNHIYGREPGFEEKAEAAIAKLGKKNAKFYRSLQKAFQERGDHEALETGHALLENTKNLAMSDRERLYGYLEGSGKIILHEPEVILTATPKMPGVDGQKMSKSYGNTISLREKPEDVEQKIKTMPTDPARVRRADPGNPEKCPVWELHKIYSDDTCKKWVQEGCTTASIGCLDCKRPLIDAINQEIAPIRERAEDIAANPAHIKRVLAEGAEHASDIASDTLAEVSQAMGMDYRYYDQ